MLGTECMLFAAWQLARVRRSMAYLLPAKENKKLGVRIFHLDPSWLSDQRDATPERELPGP